MLRVNEKTPITTASAAASAAHTIAVRSTCDDIVRRMWRVSRRVVESRATIAAACTATKRSVPFDFDFDATAEAAPQPHVCALASERHRDVGDHLIGRGGRIQLQVHRV